MPDLREFERMLTRDAGYSRSQAVIIINDGYKSLHDRTTRDAGDSEGMSDWARQMAERIERLPA